MPILSLAKMTRRPARWAVVCVIALAIPGSYLFSATRSNSAAAGEAGQGNAGPAAAQQSPFAALNPRLKALPPAASEGTTFAQFTDNRPLDLSRSGGRVGFVWGGKARGPWSAGSLYYPLDRDMNRGHTAEWYAQNAPERVVYECDRKTPAALFTYSWGYYVPLDTSNPAVRQYILDAYVLPALDSGEKIIALDNVNLRNTGRRCGVFRGGQWVQLYAGGGEDPAYASGVLAWVGWLADQIHARGGLLALNAKVDRDNVPATRKLIQLGDIWLDEAAFTHDCDARASGDAWQVKMELSQWAAARMPWVSLDKSCASPADLTDDEAQWVVANFLLAKGPQSYLGVFHDGDRGVLRYPASLNPPIGVPTGAAFAIPGGGMARRFSTGLVVVNPSSAAPLRYVLPAGSWKALNGAPVSGAITLGTTSAAVLLTQ